MRILALVAFLVPAVALAQNAGAGAAANNGLFLLEPIGGVNQIPLQNLTGLGAMGYYLNLLYPWLVGVGAAVALLHATWGGVEIVQAGADSAAVTAGRNRMLIALGGLIIILASATIMNALNPTFFQ